MPAPYDKIRCRPRRYAQLSDGVPVDPRNPLRAQALCLCCDGSDAYYSVHGELESRTIRKPASNGCIWMLNYRVIGIDEQVLLEAQAAVA